MKGFYSTSSVFGASWASMFLGSTRFRMMATMNTTATQFSANTVCTILGKSYWYDRVSVELRLKWHDVRECYDWCSAECWEIHHTHAHCYYISNHKSEQNWELLPVFGKKSQRTLDGTSHKYRSNYRIIAVCRSQNTDTNVKLIPITIGSPEPIFQIGNIWISEPIPAIIMALWISCALCFASRPQAPATMMIDAILAWLFVAFS